MGNFIKLNEDTIKTRLPSIFRDRLPQSSQLFNILQFYMQGITKRIGIQTEFYWHNALEIEQACIIAKQTKTDHNDHDTVWMLLAPVTGEKEAMLEFSKMVSWDQPASFNFVQDDIIPYLKELCEQHGGPSLCAPGYLYNMSVEAALELDISEELSSGEIEMKALTLEDIPILVQHWKLAGDNAFEEVKECAQNIPSAGLFVNGKLVSGAYTAVDGGIHAVFTLAEHRGRGYAQILLKHLSRTLAETGLIPLVQIEAYNVVSISMMKKIGFKYSHGVTLLNL